MAPTAFVAITTMDTAVAPSPASSYTIRGGGERDGFDRQADSR